MGSMLCTICALLAVVASPLRAAVSKPQQPFENGELKLLCIGNSVTRHGPAPKIGWTNDWGMAASAREKDYAHILRRKIEERTGRPVKLHVQNLAAFERKLGAFDLEGALKPEFAWKPDYVVIALGANALTPTNDAMRAAFRDNMAKLMRLWQDRVGTNLVVGGLFWPNREKHPLHLAAARSVGARYVYMSDLSKNPKNKALGLFKHSGVAGHPGDCGMAALAERLFEGLFPEPLPVWRGAAFAAWKPNNQISDCRIEGDRLVGTATGSDAQLRVKLEKPFRARGNQVFRYRLKINRGGIGQLFWMSVRDRGLSENRQCRLNMIGDGQWHDYAVRPG